MEIKLEVKDEDITPDFGRSADRLRRAIFEMFPEAVWERHGDGHRIII